MLNLGFKKHKTKHNINQLRIQELFKYVAHHSAQLFYIMQHKQFDYLPFCPQTIIIATFCLLRGRGPC